MKNKWRGHENDRKDKVIVGAQHLELMTLLIIFGKFGMGRKVRKSKM